MATPHALQLLELRYQDRNSRALEGPRHQLKIQIVPLPQERPLPTSTLCSPYARTTESGVYDNFDTARGALEGLLVAAAIAPKRVSRDCGNVVASLHEA